MSRRRLLFSFFFFNDTATPEIYTLSLPDALPISKFLQHQQRGVALRRAIGLQSFRVHDQPIFVFHQQMAAVTQLRFRSEEHTSELQSPDHLVSRLLLEKKTKPTSNAHSPHHLTEH